MIWLQGLSRERTWDKVNVVGIFFMQYNGELTSTSRLDMLNDPRDAPTDLMAPRDDSSRVATE